MKMSKTISLPGKKYMHSPILKISQMVDCYKMLLDPTENNASNKTSIASVTEHSLYLKGTMIYFLKLMRHTGA